MKPLAKFIIFLILVGCIQNKQSNSLSKREYVKTLIAKVGFQELPYKHDLSDDNINSKYDINENSMDSLFFKDLNGSVVGLLPDTSNFYCFLYFAVGDALYPCLVTIDKNGDNIDEKPICIGQCSGMIFDYDTCIDNIAIEKDLSVKMFYRLHAIVERDDSTLLVDTICNQMIWTGKVNSVGKIVINEAEIVDCK